MVKVAGRNLAISHKASYELTAFIKNKNVDSAIKALESITKLEQIVPYRRYNRDVAPKAGVGPGRYPVKAAFVTIKLLKNLKGAAKSKGLDLQKLTIIHATATKGPIRHRYGRKSGLERKNTHIELVAKEVESKKPAQPETKKEIKTQSETKVSAVPHSKGVSE
jgi:large subunit ribosomal protein L22